MADDGAPSPVRLLGTPRGRWIAFSALVLAVQAAYLAQSLERLPFLRGPVFDSVIYLRQARAVLEGRFADPALLAFSPLYGWFLAAVGATRWPEIAAIIQLALGYLNLWLVHRFVARRDGDAAGLLAAGLLFGYGLLLSWQTKLVSEPLALTLALGAQLALLGDGARAGRWRACLAAGALAGLAILARASLLFSAPFFVLAALLPWERPAALPLRRRAARAAAVAGGLALVLGANGLWNLRHTGLFVPVILVSNTVARTTAPGFGDDFRAFAGRDGGFASAFDVVRQAEERLRRGGAAAPAAGPLWGVDVAGWLAGAPRKLLRSLSDTEVTFDYGYYGERRELPLLRALPVSFGMLLWLGALGAFLRARREGARSLAPYLPWFVGALFTVTLFHTSSRYRIGMVLPLVLLAGPGVVALLRAERTRLRAILVLATAAACALLAVKTIGHQLRDPAQWELRVAQSAATVPDRDEVERRLRRALALSPHDPAVHRRARILAPLVGLDPAALGAP